MTAVDLFASFRRAEMLAARGRPLDALQALAPVLESRPDDASVQLLAGRAYLNSAQLRRAEEAFTRVVDLDPADHYARFALGKALQRQGRLAQAHTQLKMAVVMDPRPEYQEALGEVRARMALEDDSGVDGPTKEAPGVGRTSAVRTAMGVVAVLAFAAAAAGIPVAATPDQHAAVDETQYLLTAISVAEDGDLDIADELADRRWSAFADVEPPAQTAVRPDGSQLSPHDPLLPLLLAGPVALGGWVGAKLALAAFAAVLAALTLWVAVRRFAVPLPVAAVGVGVAGASAPLAVYGQQVYPELPAAVLVLAGVAALTGPVDRRGLGLLLTVVLVTPWLSVKYVPVLAVLAVLGAVRWWRAGRRREVAAAGAVATAAGVVYLAVHRVVWGGWTVYASGDFFAERGEFAVVGDAVDPSGRAVRLVALLVDRDYGLVAWQPAFLLVVPAVVALLVRRPPHVAALLLPVATGWGIATFVAATMHGFWWPGRHLLVVVPLLVLVVLVWLGRCGPVVRGVAALLGATGVAVYAGLLVDGWTGGFTWVLGFDAVRGPDRLLLPDYRADFTALHLVWCAVFVLVSALVAARSRQRVRDR